TRLQLEAGEAGLLGVLARSPATAAAGPAADAGVRGVQLADHHHDHIVQVLRVANVSQQRLIGFLHLCPIDAVHVGVVEAEFHDPPTLVEDLAALGAVIDLDVSGEAQRASSPPGGGSGIAAGRATATAAGWRSSGSLSRSPVAGSTGPGAS